MKLYNLVLAAIVTVGISSPVLAEDSPHSFSANVGVVSNYLWRGVTQADDGPAVQGGVDYAHSSGFYLGTWVSNIDWGTSSLNYDQNDGGANEVVAIDDDQGTAKGVMPGTM